MAETAQPAPVNVVEAFYDQWYEHCEGDRSFGGKVIDRDRIVLELAGEGESLLEVGCGGGFLTRLCPYERRAGVDISPRAVELARKQGIDAHLCNTDQEPLPFPDHSFDTVMFIEVLEHVYDPVRALAEANRVLKPGGRLICSSPNMGFIACRLALLGGKFTDYHGVGMIVEDHIRFYTYGSYRRLLELAGFRVEVSRGCTKEPEFLDPRHYERVGLAPPPPPPPGPRVSVLARAAKLIPTYWRLVKLGKLLLHNRMPKLFSAGIIYRAVPVGPPQFTRNSPVDFRGRDLTRDERSIHNY